ncbi:hypothetical protein GCM10009811_22330 [Nostocoides veronense]|uniref:Uncharacterized protein n=2 Tax=Nostocoides veronense TaxID=330836 RepID=A0ABP4Y3Q8_9MICO
MIRLGPSVRSHSEEHEPGGERQSMNDAYGSRGEALEIATTPASALHATGAFARAIGLITMELGGQFVGTFEPADQLYAALLAHDADAIGL